MQDRFAMPTLKPSHPWQALAFLTKTAPVQD